MNKFKAGDKVVCVGHSDQWSERYEIGSEYEIKLIPNEPKCIRVMASDKPGDWWDVLKCDFKLATDSNEMPELKGGMYIKCGDGYYVAINPKYYPECDTFEGLMEIKEFATWANSAVLKHVGNIKKDSITEIYTHSDSYISICKNQFESTLIWQKQSPKDKIIEEMEQKISQMQTKINELKEQD